MDKNPNGKPTVGGAPTQLTWQQQLMSQSWDQTPRKKKDKQPAKNADAPTRKKDKPKAPVVKAAPHMTWQQELFQQSKRVGPTFDHVADERDMQTFGGESAVPEKSALPGAAVTPERRKNGKSKGAGKQRDGRVLNTPTKDKSGTPNAYAGPTFHNSPSATSLPTPKFASRSAKSPLSEPASSEPSVAATPRPMTLPPPPQLQTVDHLLAQMLKTSSEPLGSN